MNGHIQNAGAVLEMLGVDVLLTAAQSRMDRPSVDKQDLLLVMQWAKLDLFKKVKFHYNQEKDLEVGSMLYKLFVNDCKD